MRARYTRTFCTVASKQVRTRASRRAPKQAQRALRSHGTAGDRAHAQPARLQARAHPCAVAMTSLVGVQPHGAPWHEPGGGCA